MVLFKKNYETYKTILHKWNYQKHDYEPYQVPDGLICLTYSEDMEKEVNCCQCFKKMKFGDCYTSLEVHSMPFAFGYAVCKDCYQEEWKRRKKEREE